MHALRMHFTTNILRNEIHRAGTIERDAGNNIFERGGFEFLHEALHAGGLQLENAFGLPLSDHREHTGIVVIDRGKIERLSRLPLHQTLRVLNDGQVAQAQEVHLEKAQFFERTHRILCRDRAVRCAGNGYDLFHRLRGDHDAGRVDRGMPRQPFEPHRKIEQFLNIRVFVV